MEFEKEHIALKIATLIIKKIDSELDVAEQIMLQDWLDENEANKKIYAEFSSQQSRVRAVASIEKYQASKALQRVNKRIYKKTIKLWPRVAVAAAAIVAVTFGIWLYTNSPYTSPANVQDIAPGKQGATLTLANGKQIRLDATGNGELAKEAGITISKQSDGQLLYLISGKQNNGKSNPINTLSTAKGETYLLRLADGSKVWLNAASSLTYTASLTERGERRVKLNGEAYFEVAKDKSHPFVVETANQKVKVLGTHFNINSYADEPQITTTLLEGAIEVSHLTSHNSQLLKPGQQSLNKNGNITVINANIEQVMDWQQGDFNMNHVNFKTAMRKIARWYNVEVVYDASVSDTIEAGGWISRNKKLSEVLQSIEATGQVHFKVEGRKIIVFN